MAVALIGRHTELQRVVEAFKAARGGRATMVIVRGEPGIGKSRFLAEALGQAELLGHTVLSARLDELDRFVPFAAFRLALRSALAAERLSEFGRFPEHRPSLQLRMPALRHWHAAPQALVSAEVVPWRPHRGVLVVVGQTVDENLDAWEHWLDAEHHPAVHGTPGVAGVWVYGSSDAWELHPATQGHPQHTTVIYLDEDPVETTEALRPLIEERWRGGTARPSFAGPLRSMIEWEAWR